MTDNQIKKIEELAKDLTVEQVADYLGINHVTFHDLASKDARIMVAYNRGKTLGIMDAAEVLWKGIRNGSLTATMFYLKTQAKWQENKPEELNIPQISSQPQFNFIVSNKASDNLKDVTIPTTEFNLKIREQSRGN